MDSASPVVEAGAEQPIDDEGFELFCSLYSCDRAELNATLESADDNPPVLEKGDRLLRCCLSRRASDRTSSLAQECRAAVPGYPVPSERGKRKLAVAPGLVAQGDRGLVVVPRPDRPRCAVPGLERFAREALPAGGELTPSQNRALIIARTKDLCRSIDYLQTREDIDVGKIGYFGFSRTSERWPIYGAIEERIGAAALWLGGMNASLQPPEVETVNFAPRAKAPALMLNGEWDSVIPRRNSERLYRFLGTPDEQKKLFHFEGGHIPIDRVTLVDETLDFFDRYLGPVAE